MQRKAILFPEVGEFNTLRPDHPGQKLTLLISMNERARNLLRSHNLIVPALARLSATSARGRFPPAFQVSALLERWIVAHVRSQVTSSLT